jgi:hypothetical protein
VVQETSRMKICTPLRGEKVWWSRFQYKSKIRSVFNPITKQYYSYRVETAITTEEPTVLFKNDVQDHKVKLLSYLIHSIDAAVIQTFISKITDRGYLINTLHDCVLLHPNYVTDFYQIVREVSISRNLYDSASTMVFDQVKSYVSVHSRQKIGVM